MVEELLSQYPRYIEPLIEKGMLLESQAEAGQGEWSAACQHWQDLAQKLSRTRPRPLAYFDAWYHAAYALHQQNENTEGPPDPQRRHAPESGRRQPRNEEQVRAVAEQHEVVAVGREASLYYRLDPMQRCHLDRELMTCHHGCRVTAISNDCRRRCQRS